MRLDRRTTIRTSRISSLFRPARARTSRRWTTWAAVRGRTAREEKLGLRTQITYQTPASEPGSLGLRATATCCRCRLALAGAQKLLRGKHDKPYSQVETSAFPGVSVHTPPPVCAG